MNKLFSLFRSRRFWATMGGTAVVASGDTLGMSQQETTTVAGLIAMWIFGDTTRRTE